MKRCRLKRCNFQIRNKMSKETEAQKKMINGNDFIADVICCGYFEQTFKNYQWFSRLDEDGNKLLLMPCFPENKIRINNCPVCGEKVRSVEIKEEVFNHYI